MKRNPQDEYTTVEGDVNLIEDAETGEKLLFIIDEKNSLVFRSFLEEDINPFIDSYDKMSSSEKRKKKRILYEELPVKGSQMYYFAIEKIVGEKRTDTWDEIYGLPRIPIGLGARTTKETALKERNGEPSIEAFVYTKYENMAVNVSNILEQVARIFEIKIDGVPKILPCWVPQK